MRHLRLGMMILCFTLMLSSRTAFAQESSLSLTVIGGFTHGGFDETAAEDVAYDPTTQELFVTNAGANTVDILDLSDPTTPTLLRTIDLSAYGGSVTSVAVRDGIAAIAIAAEDVVAPGSVGFFNAEGELVARVEVGTLPDHVVFTPDGTRVLSANEGQPNDDYTIDPEGSVSIIDISGGIDTLTQDNVLTVGFADFNVDGARSAELPADVRIYGPNATVAQDLEPEYIAVTPDSAVAAVTLQENNAVAVIDIANAEVIEIRALGFKDHNLEGNGLDLSDDDGMINIANWPVLGMYQPDGIAAFEIDGSLYFITANEGDARDYDGFSEETDVSEMTLDPAVFPNAEELQQAINMGNLTATASSGDIDGDGDFDQIFANGARSFSIWSADGALIYDSGDALERITAELYPEDFNSTNDENGSFDNRSDNKGPEPEEVAVGVIGERTYAFIGLERIGGVMVFNISEPAAPTFVTYVNNRDFAGNPEDGSAGDLGAEGVIFVPAAVSPNGADLVIVANEVSGTTTIFQVTSGA